MDKFVNLTMSGAVSGAIYSLIASGVVLTYTTARVFNFAQGATAFLSAYLFFQLHTSLGWPTAAAALVTILVFAPLFGVIMDRVLFRHLAEATEVTRIVATIGLLVALPQAALFLVETLIESAHMGLNLGDRVFLPPGLGPVPRITWHPVSSVVFDSNQLVIVITAAVAAAALWFLLQRTTLGLSLRATVDRRSLASLRGINPDRVSRVGWVMSTVLAALAGVVGATIFNLAPGPYTLVLFVATTAAVLGRLRSIPVAFLGGILLGVLQNWVSPAGYLPPALAGIQGFGASAPFVLLFVGLFFLGRDRARVAGVASDPERATLLASNALDRRARVIWLLLAAGLVVYIQSFASVFYVSLFCKGLALGLILLSFTVVTGLGGMVSLAQASFATGGALTAGFLMSHGVPWWLAVLGGGVFAMLSGLLVAIPALRLGGLFLALATLAMAYFFQNVVFAVSGFANSPNGWPLNRPNIGGLRLGIGYERNYAALLMVVLLVAVWMVRNLQRSRSGRAVLAVRSSESAAATSGVSSMEAKLGLFAFSALLAGIGGVLFASVNSQVNSVDNPVEVGLVWFAVVVTFGIRRPSAAVLAGIAYALIPQLVSGVPGNERIMPILFGLGAINLATNPDGFVSQYGYLGRAVKRRVLDLAGRPAGGSAPTDVDPARVHVRAARVEAAAPEGVAPVLRLRGVDAGYGAVAVLHGVDLSVCPGRLLAVLGPNGAGKSTLAQVLGGLVRPSAGEVMLTGDDEGRIDLTGRPAHVFARQGILLAPESRGVFPGLTVEDNLRTSLPSAEQRGAVYDRFPALHQRRHQPAGNLSGGEQQMLTVAPLLVHRPRVVIGDEPTLGLAPRIVEELMVLFAELRDAGVAVVLTEEKAHQLLEICDDVAILELGEIVWSDRRSALDTDRLTASYLGAVGEGRPTA